MLILSLLRRQSLPLKNPAPRWPQMVQELLCDNWNTEISLQQIAFAAGIHPVTVSKYFARYFGCSLGEFRRRLKIERALQMMNSSNKSLTEIAYACGFFDQSHFIRAFKEASGFSPKQFAV
jgi:AraC family transcriptional regulator